MAADEERMAADGEWMAADGEWMAAMEEFFNTKALRHKAHREEIGFLWRVIRRGEVRKHVSA
jgi:hypothetical protein